MVSLLWTILANSLAQSAVVICLIHAGYKSAFFLATGKILSKFVTYSDVIGISSALKSFIALISIFLIGFKSTSYAAQKHALDGLSSDGNSFLMMWLLAAGLLSFWVLSIRLTSAQKSSSAISSNDLPLVFMLLTLLIFSSGLFGQSANVVAVSSFVVLPFLRFLSTCTSPNLGSVNLSSSTISALLTKYDFLQIAVFQISTNFNFVTLIGILVFFVFEF
jgi:hypothetical protein